MSKDLLAKYWKKMALFSIMAIISIVSFLYVSTDNRITRAEASIDKKVDKEQYYKDIESIKSGQETILNHILRGKR